jgi:hypothetical protein
MLVEWLQPLPRVLYWLASRLWGKRSPTPTLRRMTAMG